MKASLFALCTLLLAGEIHATHRALLIGINDYTALHMAVGERNLPVLRILLEAGADPRLRTRIDDYETPRETAQRAGFDDMARLLAEYEARLEK